VSSTFAQYPEWQRSGAITILTTPEGANLPAGTVAEGFPLLVRLHKDWFEFKQAKAGGEGVRFSSSKGAPLVFQIEEWARQRPRQCRAGRMSRGAFGPREGKMFVHHFPAAEDWSRAGRGRFGFGHEL